MSSRRARAGGAREKEIERASWRSWDGSPGVPEEHPERLVVVVVFTIAARFHGGVGVVVGGAAFQEALLAGAGAARVHRGRAERDGHPPLRAVESEREWNGIGCARARGWVTRGKAYVRRAAPA